MGERIGLEIDVEIAQAAKSVGELRKAFDDAKKKAIEIGKAFGENSEQFKKAEAALGQMVNQFAKFGNLKTDLREAQKILVAMTEAFGAGSKEAVAAAQAVAQFKDQIGDAKELSDAFNPDRKFQAFSNSISGVLGGFSALTGAMALFGGESKDVEKVLLKVQGAMALSQGINSVLAAKDSFIALATVIRTQVVAAFATLKGALISTGIGALVVGIGLAIKYFVDLAAAADEATEAQKRALAERTRIGEIVNTDVMAFLNQQEKLEVSRAKADGKSEQDIYNIQQKYRKSRLVETKKFYEEIKHDKERAKEVDKKITEDEIEIEVSKNERLSQINTKRNQEADRVAKERETKRKENLKRELDQIKRDFEEATKLQDELKRGNAKSGLTPEQQELLEAKQRFDDRIKILQKGGLSILEAQIAFEEERKKINEKYRAEEKEAFKKAEEDKLEIQKKNDEEKLRLHTEFGKSSGDELIRNINATISNESISADKRKEILQTTKDYVLATTQFTGEQKIAILAALAKAEEDLDNATLAHKYAIYDSIAQGAGVLSDIIGQNTVVGKAFAVAQASISTYSAIAKQLEAFAGVPIPGYAIAQSVITGLVGLAQIKKIVAVKVPGKGSGGSFAGGSLASNTTGGAQLNPALQTNTTVLDPKSINDMANQAIKVYVTEGDIRKAGDRVDRIKKAAIFG